MSNTDPDLQSKEKNLPIAIDVVGGNLVVKRHSGKVESFPLAGGVVNQDALQVGYSPIGPPGSALNGSTDNGLQTVLRQLVLNGGGNLHYGNPVDEDHTDDDTFLTHIGEDYEINSDYAFKASDPTSLYVIKAGLYSLSAQFVFDGTAGAGGTHGDEGSRYYALNSGSLVGSMGQTIHKHPGWMSGQAAFDVVAEIWPIYPADLPFAIVPTAAQTSIGVIFAGCSFDIQRVS
jgi:hypothetical protein